jgi:hypothetical protein
LIAESSHRRNNFLAVFSLIFIELLVYGPFVSSKGFYWDDWPTVSIYNLFGHSGLTLYYTGNQPLAAWMISLLFPVLGVNPLGWHWMILGVSSLIGIAVYATLSALWPERRDVAWLTAAFVLLFPGFTQQSIAVTYLPHYVSLLLFVLSLQLTLVALDNPRWYWIAMIGAIMLGLGSYTLTEYFIGLELFRLLAIAYRTRGTGRVRVSVSPYLAVWIVFLVWRTSFSRAADHAAYKEVGTNVHQAMHHPIHAILDRTGVYFYNLITGGLLTWFRPFHTNLIEGSKAIVGFEWSLGIAVFLMSVAALRSLKSKEEAFSRKFSVAVGALLASGLPLLVAGFRADLSSFPAYGDRFLLPFILASSLFAALLLLRRVPVLLLAGMLAVLTVFQVQTQRAYRIDWRLQKSIFWQVTWRAPRLRQETGVYVDGLPNSIFSNHTAGILDQLYGPKPAPRTLNYFIFDLAQFNQPNLDAGSIASGAIREYQFHGPIENSLVMWVSPGGVLYTVDGGSNTQVHFSGICDNLAHLSIPAHVIIDAPSPQTVLTQIYGGELKHEWLYYYQRAELKHQDRMWDDVAQIGDEAQQKGFQPTEGAEWLPFIDAYARMHRYADAERLTRTALKQSPEIEEQLSALWNNVLALQSAAAPVRIIQALKQQLDIRQD